MSRDVSAAFRAALAEADLRPVIFFEGVFASGTLRLWSGLGAITWAGQSWAGAGTLLGIGSIGETGDVVASGTTISLSGVPLQMVQLAIEDARQGLPGRVWLGLRDTDGRIIADPVLAFSGRLDVPEIIDNEESCTVSITYESRLIDLNTPREWRYTHESQQALYPGDLGFEYVTAIQDKEIKWGR